MAVGPAASSSLVSAAVLTEESPEREAAALEPAAPLPGTGMPGPFPGRVIETRSSRSILDNRVDFAVVQEMIGRGMAELTGASSAREAWRVFFNEQDIVGIKVNASGVPGCVSSPEIVNAVILALNDVGIPFQNIYLYERFSFQMDLAGYHATVPPGVHVTGFGNDRGDLRSYDKSIYYETCFFGEEETRSYLGKLVSQRLTKIVNIPNLKDHGAAGVTGCLKNIAYGSFDNVARSHQGTKTYTKTFIGELCRVEPLRSKTVLQVMDGLRGVYHGGPFAPNQKYMWFPGLIYLGTDPVAIDRIELDIIEAKRREKGLISLWDRSPKNIITGEERGGDPNKNRFYREPGHIHYAGSLGLGIHDRKRIQLKQLLVS
ncbi:MAG: DUF362 domain-containing protein [Acidobacteriota bacterium]